jgi:hypothetical protein
MRVRVGAASGFRRWGHRRGALEDPLAQAGQLLDELRGDDLTIGAADRWRDVLELLEQRANESGVQSQVDDARTHAGRN